MHFPDPRNSYILDTFIEIENWIPEGGVRGIILNIKLLKKYLQFPPTEYMLSSWADKACVYKGHWENNSVQVWNELWRH